ncbi:MAG: ABC transporter permease subunit [Parachlamydiaceae bacterium]|nr:ABC transporter permease subunit [Parachlamydiaceae bacterium]
MKNETLHAPIYSYWQTHWKQFKKHYLGYIGFWVVVLFCLVGIYAPFLASSKPLFVLYEGTAYFPLFRVLFYPEFFTKPLDIFFNILMFTFPFMFLCLRCEGLRYRGKILFTLCVLQMALFAYVIHNPATDPTSDPELILKRNHALASRSKFYPNWDFDLHFMDAEAKLNQLLKYRQKKLQHERLRKYTDEEPQTLFYREYLLEKSKIEQQKKTLEKTAQTIKSKSSQKTEAKINYSEERLKWIESESLKLQLVVMPLLRSFHWEDDAGGSQSFNQKLSWWELTRINRKDLLAALIFGVRISLVVGFLAVGMALVIAIPIGALAGFYGGKVDIIVSRLLEIWEAMPTFFMLLMAVAILQSKSIFIVIAIIGLFGWTGFSRYLRGEFLKQRSLPYVEACFALGYRNSYIMFSHILPNAIPPLLTLLPFAMMGAITSEAGLSFLGLGEEGSCSWGVLMEEGRSAFPGESNLLWPPAALLTTLLVAIALVGDALRDTFDPKMHKG